MPTNRREMLANGQDKMFQEDAPGANVAVDR